MTWPRSVILHFAPFRPGPASTRNVAEKEENSDRKEQRIRGRDNLARCTHNAFVLLAVGSPFSLMVGSGDADHRAVSYGVLGLPGRHIPLHEPFSPCVVKCTTTCPPFSLWSKLSGMAIGLLWVLPSHHSQLQSGYGN